MGQSTLVIFASPFLIAAAATLGGAPEPATVQQIDPAFNGTIVSVYPDGRVSKLWLNRDGSFSAEGRSHEHQAGQWRIRSHQVCMTQSKPVPIPFLSYCAAIPAAGLASGWTGKAVTGEPISIHLAPGR